MPPSDHRAPQISSTSFHELGPSKPLGKSGVFCWIVVLLLTGFVLWRTGLQKQTEAEQDGPASATDLIQINLQAKMMTAQKSLLELADGSAPAGEGQQSQAPQLDQPAPEQQHPDDEVASGDPIDPSTSDPENIEQNKPAKPAQVPLPDGLDTGMYEQRLCYAIILNEIRSPQEAIKYLEGLDRRVADSVFEPSESQLELRASIGAAFRDYAAGDFDASSLSPAQRDQLKERLGYCGSLLLAPEEKAGNDRADLITDSQTLAFTLIGVLVLGLLLLLAGVVSLCMILVTISAGRSPIRFLRSQRSSSIYIETFTIWLAGFLFLPSLLLLIPNVGVGYLPYVLQLVFAFGSLVALVWPVLRGISISQMLEDIGWKTGHIFKDVALGFAAYPAWLPAVVVAFVLVFTMIAAFPQAEMAHEFMVPPTPNHPIQAILAEGDWVVWILTGLAACVAAPVVEETMFRGVLYQHLRQVTSSRYRIVNALVAGLVNGVIFAAIHPQGVMAIPLLATLAIGFSLVREWRGSLWTSVTMHAINNTLALSIALLVF